MQTPRNDNDLFQIMREELYSAVIGDVMDKMGYLHQFLPPEIQPLRKDMVIVGRAMPVLEADCFEEISTSGHNSSLAKPFGLMLEALDDLKENEVYICTGSSADYALWGEIMSTRAGYLGAAGAVVNGYSRDTKGILSLNFPVFSRGRYAKDQSPRGKVIDFRVPLEIGGVRINPGDIMFGDMEGVIIIPAGIEKEVIDKALEKAQGEKTVQQMISKGMSAKEAFEKYGIL